MTDRIRPKLTKSHVGVYPERAAPSPRADDAERRKRVDRWIHLYKSGEWQEEVVRLIAWDEGVAERMEMRKAANMRPAEPMREKPTASELQAVECISHGLDPVEAGDVLGKSHYTIKAQLKTARARAAAKTTNHLVGICLRNGWIT